jgi:hypothetical protein
MANSFAYYCCVNEKGCNETGVRMVAGEQQMDFNIII